MISVNGNIDIIVKVNRMKESRGDTSESQRADLARLTLDHPTLDTTGRRGTPRQAEIASGCQPDGLC